MIKNLKFESVFVDTALFIYFLEDNPIFGEKTAQFFQFCYEKRKKIYTSIISHLEFSVKPYRENNVLLIDNYRQLLIDANIKVSTIQELDCDLAARLRAKYMGLKNFDALQIAVAIN